MDATDDACAGASLSIEERLAEQFYAWELRGRGWWLHEKPMQSEPPFVPFFGHWLPDVQPADDGQRHTLLSGLVDWLHSKLTRKPAVAAKPDEPEELEPVPWDDPGELVELHVSLPPDLDVSPLAAEHLLLSLSSCRHPPAFEIIGSTDAIEVQFTCSADDADRLRGQLQAHFPKITVATRTGTLQDRWREAEGAGAVIAELGLSREFMLPLALPRNFAVDPLLGVAAALAGVARGEVALVQVLFQPVCHPWAESVLRSVTFADGSPLFVGVRDFLKQATAKVSRPLYAAVLRIACRSREEGRATDLARQLVGALAPLADPEGNELFPLDNEEYDEAKHEQDLLLRRSRRSGMLLSSEELAALVHLPSESVRIAKLRPLSRKTKAPPVVATGGSWILGENEHAGENRDVTLTPEQRARHVHVIGVSGTGKSTLLLNLILQDIQNGDGVAVLDPHGDLIDAVLARVPPQRAEDVVLFDPADEEYPVGFNVLAAHSALEQNLLASDLVAVFRRLSTSWGDQMNAVLANAILAFLESDAGGTLGDLRRFLVEPAFRKKFLTTVTDAEVVYYWSKEYPLLRGRPEGPVLTRLDGFLRPKSIRYMVCQHHSKLDFGRIMDEGKIFLARLSHGAIGEENAHLLGALLVAKFHQFALGRQRQREAERRYFWMHVDEFQNFATPSMAALLSGVRKYRLGLVLAHQELRQLESKAPDVAGAVLANAYTRICFRVGDQDAKKLAEGFADFEAADLMNLGTGQAIGRVERPDFAFNLSTPNVPAVADEQQSDRLRASVVAVSRAKYAVPRAEVEAELRQASQAMVDASGDELTVRAAKPTPTPEIAAEQASIPLSGPAQPPSAPVPMGETLAVPAQEPAEQPAPRKAKPVKIAAKVPTEDVLLGRGGAQHKYLQQLIKQYAEGLGYKASIEQNVLGGRGVDVALTKGSTSVACEICITTDDEHELGNVRKCLAAGYQHVAAVTPEATRLAKLRTGIEVQLCEADKERVHFFLPDELLGFLRELAVRQMDQEQTVRGYKVKTKYKALDGEQGSDRRAAISQVVAKSFKRSGARSGPGAVRRVGRHTPAQPHARAAPRDEQHEKDRANHDEDSDFRVCVRQTPSSLMRAKVRRMPRHGQDFTSGTGTLAADH